LNRELVQSLENAAQVIIEQDMRDHDSIVNDVHKKRNADLEVLTNHLQYIYKENEERQKANFEELFYKMVIKHED
jgi:hypothetical protein